MLASLELAPPELVAWQTLLLYAPPEPEVCRHLRCQVRSMPIFDNRLILGFW